MNRIRDKIIEIEKFLKELEVSIPKSLEDYKNDFKLRAIGERYFEKIVEAMSDLSFLIIKEKKLKQPEEEENVFEILMNNNIISRDLAERFKKAKGMRNILSHQYGNIDDEVVFDSITKELQKDVNEFIEIISKLIS